MTQIKRATGCTISAAALEKERSVWITEYGAAPEKNPVQNTEAVNAAITAMHGAGGGTVEIPEGDFHIYTLRLKSNVNLHLNRGAVLHAARTDITKSYEKQKGEGGNYDEPEVNLYAGLQDHGHTYFANSLFYGADIENVMIYGEGLIDGSYIEEETGYRRYVLQGGDPFDNPSRKEKGHTGEWFGNKAIALVRTKNVVLKDFRLLIGGHFAIIAEGVTNMLVEHVLVDTTRDAIDIDCCQDVTVRDSVFNSLTDDALVLKSSYGAGIFMPTKNVLIEDCVVSGYDAGSVYAGKYTRDKLIATDRCGPTARVKLGTESTCGYELVTVKRVSFDRSRGFALEAVDGSDLKDIVFTDCTMDNVSSSPIFIRAGERGRFPVTGNSQEEPVNAGAGNVRLDNLGWVLPNREEYQKYPARRFAPSYVKDRAVCVDGHSEFRVVNPDKPCLINEANIVCVDGRYYAKKYNEESQSYEPDLSREIFGPEKYANACGSDHMARVSNIEISNVKITNADPRYPIILMGLMDSRLKNIVIEHVEVEYRGGLSMEHAVEQRQLNTNWKYTQYETKSSIQTLPWLVNTFFLKEEGLLPRADWDEERKAWRDDPYNVPELPAVYPEPSNWGILPAYGLYARHVEELRLHDIKMTFKVEDERHPIVLDDVKGAELSEIQSDCSPRVKELALVTNTKKRPTHLEYIPEEPYLTTTVEDITVPDSMKTVRIQVDAPAPGTPSDSLYPYPTAACPENGYSFAVRTEYYPLPLTVHRPFFLPVAAREGYCGAEMAFTVAVRNPALEATEEESESFIYNEAVKKKDFTVGPAKVLPELTVRNLPEGASFHAENGRFMWIPRRGQEGRYELEFVYDDGVIPETMKVELVIQ